MQQSVCIRNEKNMTASQAILDLSVLTDQARAAIIDFYEFLLRKYGKSVSQPSKKPGQKRFSQFLSESFHVETWKKYSREELHERR